MVLHQAIRLPPVLSNFSELYFFFKVSLFKVSLTELRFFDKVKYIHVV